MVTPEIGLALTDISNTFETIRSTTFEFPPNNLEYDYAPWGDAWYSYDDEGRVEWMKHKLPGLTTKLMEKVYRYLFGALSLQN